MNFLNVVEKYTDGASLIFSWLGDGGVTVPQELAQQRADICNECHYNGSESLAKAGVGDALKKIIEIKNKSKLRVVGEKTLGSCEICLCHLRTKIHVPIEQILKCTPKEALMAQPDYCWQRIEIPKCS